MILAPRLYKLNLPIKKDDKSDIVPLNRTLNESDAFEPNSTEIGANVSFQKRMEDAFFRSHSRSLQRSVEFVVERITSNCVKDFRTNLIPDVIREVNLEVKGHLISLVKTVENDEDRNAKGEIFVENAVARCIQKCLEKCLFELEEFCGKACNEALPVLLGPDISNEVAKQAVSIAKRDAIEKCSGKHIFYLQNFMPNLTATMDKPYTISKNIFCIQLEIKKA